MIDIDEIILKLQKRSNIKSEELDILCKYHNFTELCDGSGDYCI
jgi:hypothetical protein